MIGFVLMQRGEQDETDRKDKNKMKNQKITIANIDAVTFNAEKELVEKIHIVIPTMQKLTDKDIKEYVRSEFDHRQVLMVKSIEYRTNLYAIVATFKIESMYEE